MLQTLHTEGLGPFKTLDMTFGSRLNVITGDNGDGKSLILNAIKTCLDWEKSDEDYSIYRAMLDKANAKFKYCQNSFSFRSDLLSSNGFFEPPEQAFLLLSITTDKITRLSSPVFSFYGNKPVILGNLERAQLWNGTGRQDSNEVRDFEGLRSDWRIWQRDAKNYDLEKKLGELGQQVYIEQLKKELEESKDAVSQEKLKKELEEWQNKIYEEPFVPFNTLQEVIKNLWEAEETVPKPIEQDGYSPFHHQNIPIPQIQLPYGKVLLTELAEGMKQVLSLAYSLVWLWKTHTDINATVNNQYAKRLIILIDEIELHLHPKWQRKILPGLLDAVKTLDKNLQVQIIATTHSPMVTASLEPLFDPEQDKLFTLELQDGEVKVHTIGNPVVGDDEWIPKGNASNWLKSEVFDADDGRSSVASSLINTARTIMQTQTSTKEQIEELQQKLAAHVPASDPFWVGWYLYRDETFPELV